MKWPSGLDSGYAIRMREPDGLPVTPAGRLEAVLELIRNRDPVTGRFVKPLLSRAKARELLETLP